MGRRSEWWCWRQHRTCNMMRPKQIALEIRNTCWVIGVLIRCLRLQQIKQFVDVSQLSDAPLAFVSRHESSAHLWWTRDAAVTHTAVVVFPRRHQAPALPHPPWLLGGSYLPRDLLFCSTRQECNPKARPSDTSRCFQARSPPLLRAAVPPCLLVMDLVT